jgi:hypothetical protein
VSGQQDAAGTSETPTVIRGACILLMITGFASVMFSVPVILDAAGARCQLSRSYIDQANKDKKEWNNVDTGGKKPKDVPCADAVALAKQIPRHEKGNGKIPVPSESALSTQNFLAAVMGAGQAISGFYLIRSLGRWARNAAIGFSGISLILQVLGVLSLGAFVFVAYALVFSAASREVWPREGPPRD